MKKKKFLCKLKTLIYDETSLFSLIFFEISFDSGTDNMWRKKKKIIAWDRHSDPTKRIEGKAQNKNTSPYPLYHTHNNYIDKIRKNYVFFYNYDRLYDTYIQK